MIGYAILVDNNEELIFSLVGMDYQYNEQYRIYQRLLLEIVRYGILKNYKSIDFGQTTYDAKLKLGCRYYNTYLQLSHSCRFIQGFTMLFKNKLVKKHKELPEFHVFKEEGY